MNEHDQDDATQPLSMREVAGSIFAAVIGVQSNRNRERDFRRGSARQYIVAGLIATLTFLGLVYALVKTIVSSAAG